MKTTFTDLQKRSLKMVKSQGKVIKKSVILEIEIEWQRSCKICVYQDFS